MTNPYYTKTGNPRAQSRGLSSQMRSEFDLIEDGFDSVKAANDLKADIDSPAFTGTPTAPTPAVGDGSTKVATTKFVMDAALTAELPGQAGNSGRFLRTNGSTASWVDLDQAFVVVTYADRNDLRTGSYTDDQVAIVEGLGVFVFDTSSAEIDDDETCFAATGGQWILQAPAADVIEAMHEFYASSNPVVLHGSAACSITSVNAVTQVSFTGTVSGAEVGDPVVATPPDALSARVSCFARVTSPSTVTIYINNPSAATATLVAGTWQLAVFKES